LCGVCVKILVFSSDTLEQKASFRVTTTTSSTTALKSIEFARRGKYVRMPTFFPICTYLSFLFIFQPIFSMVCFAVFLEEHPLCVFYIICFSLSLFQNYTLIFMCCFTMLLVHPEAIAFRAGLCSAGIYSFFPSRNL